LAVAADSLAAMGLAEETALCRSLADDAAAAAAGGRASLSLAAGVGMLLRRAGADEDALSVFTWSVEAFGRDGSRDEVRVAIAGRAQALLSLARFDECVLACGDGLGAIVGQAGNDADVLRKDLLKTQALALIGAGDHSRAGLVTAALEELAMSAPVGPGALVEISRTYAQLSGWREALDALAAAERVAAAGQSAGAQAGPGFFVLARAELLDEMGEHDAASELVERARSSHGTEMLAIFDARLEAMVQLPEPERSRRNAMMLSAKAKLVDGWREDPPPKARIR